MVKVTKDHGFTKPGDPRRFLDLFAGRQQLIVYHLMFDPSWGAGCPLCTEYVNNLGDLKMLQGCDTAFALVSRASSAKLEAYRALKGWRWPWFSSSGSDFNYDFHVTIDATVAPATYNYREVAADTSFEVSGYCVFLRIEGEVFHTYSTYARRAAQG